jgi:hypothetical protein
MMRSSLGRGLKTFLGFIADNHTLNLNNGLERNVQSLKEFKFLYKSVGYFYNHLKEMLTS